MTIHLLPHSGAESGCAALMALADSLETCSAVVDASGRIVGFTEAWRSFQGRNPFVAGLSLGDAFGEVCKGLVRSPDGNLSIVALGLISILEGKVPRLAFDYPYPEEDGPHVYGCTAVSRPTAAPVRAVVHIRDITQRVAMERRMRRSDRLFKATTDNAMDFICLLDSESRVAYHNPALHRFLGDKEQLMPHHKLADLVHEEDRPGFLEALKRGAKAGLTQVFEYRIPDAQGRWIEMEGQVSAVEDPGGPDDAVLLVSRDVSLRKQMQREREQAEIQIRHSQKLESIGQLAAGIAHEINTPTQYIGDNTTFLRDAFAQSMGLIRTLQGHIEAIRNGGGPGVEEAGRALAALEAGDTDYLEEEIPKAIQQTLEGVARVSKIVGAMKDFSHPGVEAQSALDLHRAIESTITVSQGEWKSVAILETEFDPRIPLVPCYPGEINQVVLNLVVNAAHAIGEKRERERGTDLGLIRVGTRLREREVEVWVSDDGTGIPKEHQARVFDPFFTTKPVGKGSGQGLSIVHGVITEKHKGRILLESSPGVGTTFRFFLPLDAGQS